MAHSRLPTEIGKPEFVYLVLYRLRTMSDEEKKNWFKKWAEIRKTIPKEIRVITEAGNAFGTEFTGFTVFEGPLDKFEVLYEILDKETGPLVERTKTIIGTKGLISPTSDFERILASRPID